MGDTFPAAVYLLCFGTSGACAWLLARSYRTSRARFLMWSALCFFFLACNNLLVVFDLLVVPQMSLQIPRLLCSLCAVAVLLFGFIWDMGEER